MKNTIISHLALGGIFLILSGCVAKDNVYSSGSSKLLQSQPLISGQNESRKKSDAPTIDLSYSKQVIIDEDTLPLPEMDIYAAFFDERAENINGEYYEEFKEFNVPMAMTKRVTQYIKLFTERIPETTQNWLNRANKYMYIAKDIFVREGLPTDLLVLGFTESGFNTHAVSVAGAAGMWQFIPSTGKLYGMENNFWVDERRDFEKSTIAAAKYLKYLHSSFGDWYLALAAYNAGPGRIANATRKHDTKDYFALTQHRYTLKLETRDYVPKFLALLIIYKNYLKYGFTSPSEKPLLYENVEVTSITNLHWLSKELGVEVGMMRELNPALKLPMTPPVANYVIRVPYGYGEQAKTVLDETPADIRAMYKIYNASSGEKVANIASKYGVSVKDIQDINAIGTSQVYGGRPIFIPLADNRDADSDKMLTKYLARTAVRYYKVKKGDTFIAIAQRHNMRVRELQRLNPDINTSRLKIGQQIAIGGNPVKAVKSTKTAYQTARYTVQSGDTLWGIARKFGTTVDSIKNVNNLDGESIRPGKVLAIK